MVILHVWSLLFATLVFVVQPSNRIVFWNKTSEVAVYTVILMASLNYIGATLASKIIMQIQILMLACNTLPDVFFPAIFSLRQICRKASRCVVADEQNINNNAGAVFSNRVTKTITDGDEEEDSLSDITETKLEITVTTPSTSIKNPSPPQRSPYSYKEDSAVTRVVLPRPPVPPPESAQLVTSGYRRHTSMETNQSEAPGSSSRLSDGSRQKPEIISRQSSRTVGSRSSLKKPEMISSRSSRTVESRSSRGKPELISRRSSKTVDSHSLRRSSSSPTNNHFRQGSKSPAKKNYDRQGSNSSTYSNTSTFHDHMAGSFTAYRTGTSLDDVLGQPIPEADILRLEKCDSERSI